ncbi:tRNA pseudouridine synthase B [Paraliobacillus ryukyuensis]|uniref:tRNA pseudouridine synthase B n=1 Tax=Paraliobacillus ryukyuensis TaxID=200904 RepID=A0A366EJZ7_9BACI|nr:tRNA pseudouridine(55) synthase TruB [Paraliobacillus ryukyuensis]RBP01755.1 tRNA pseudouridine synthase B [Paraliobacillus ryukyuensis]
MNGIIPLWKEKGWTSHDCVMKLRRICQTKKVGHTGTLDPEVEGVLPICIGKATKIVPFLTDTKKTYFAEVTLGYATETEDATGQTMDKKPISEQIASEKISETLQTFVGEITQVVPLYSAVRVNGRKLYEYARLGIPVERPQRNVMIDAIQLDTSSIVKKDGLFRFSFQVTCSKGTYIRTLCVDIGKKLGYPAHMSSLIRTQTGGFSEKESFTIDEVKEKQEQGKIAEVLLPISSGVAHMHTIEVDKETAIKVTHGQKLPKPVAITTDDAFCISHHGNVLAIYSQHPENNNEIKPVRVL